MSDQPRHQAPSPQSFSIRRTLRLSSFQIGSAMADILTASVWNRVMISELGIPAWPVGLLLAIRYLLAPLSLWAGHRSDTTPLWGKYRTSYIWLGRLLMVLSFPLLGLSLGRFSADTGDVAGWAVAVLSFTLYGMGALLSGSPFLALVRDSAPPRKQGLAISMVETALIALFPVVAIGFGRWMQAYDEATFWQMVLVTMAVGGFFWFFAVAGVEAQNEAGHAPRRRREPGAVTVLFRRIWRDDRTRRFFFFLSLATFSAWMQDNILEPFGGDVFRLDVGTTTRFTGYWGSATVLVLVFSFYVWRQRPPVLQASVAKIGLVLMAAGMGMVALSSFTAMQPLLIPALVLYGAGFGLYTFGGLSLMAVMSPSPNAGAYLGLWSISILIFKGLGTFFGGAFRDLFLFNLDLSLAVAYGLVFVIAAAGLVGAALLLSGLDVVSFAVDTGRVEMGD